MTPPQATPDTASESMTEPGAAAQAAEHPVLRRFAERARGALPDRIERIVLYGSRARGEAREDSDWDVAVLLRSGPVDSSTHRALSGIAYGMLMEHDVFIQVMPLRPEAWQDETPFARRLRREGVDIPG